MPLTTLLYAEINLFCVVIMFLAYFRLKTGPHLHKTRQLFLWLLLSNVLFFLVDSLWCFVQTSSSSSYIKVNILFNVLYFILSGVIGFSWFCYSENRQDSRITKSKPLQWISILPLAVLVVTTIISVNTGWLFYVDQSNIYHRGVLYIMQPVICCGYVSFTAAKAFIRSLHTWSYVKKLEYRTLSIFVVPPVIAGIASVFLPGIPVLCVGITFATLYVYIDVQQQLISIDPLTGLDNRNSMMNMLSGKLNHSHTQNGTLCLLMIDVDYFKHINDVYGHVEGDRALKTVSQALRRACSEFNCMIYRYGGDEFSVICESQNLKDYDALCSEIHAILTIANQGMSYKLHLSIGCAVYNESVKNEQDLIRMADAELYKIKQARKTPEHI